jgi:hypothetical protein
MVNHAGGADAFVEKRFHGIGSVHRRPKNKSGAADQAN